MSANHSAKVAQFPFSISPPFIYSSPNGARMPTTNHQLILHSRPTDLITPDVLQLTELPIPALTEGQALARITYLSIDPTMRIWMADIPQYMPPVQLGEVMRALGVAEVIESRHPDFQKDDKVTGFTGLQEYLLVTSGEAHAFRKLPSIPSLSDADFLATLGINGFTAYFGLLDIAKPQPGETLVVSAAAGATGSIAGQIGRIHGCRVVGIAGSDEKCKWIQDHLGFDAAINYKHLDWKQQLAAATPNGVDINFENVGGPVMHAVLDRMNLHGRVVLCGLISGYTHHDPALSSFSQILMKRLHVQGFLVIDYLARFAEAAQKLATWKISGTLKDKHTILPGLTKAPEAINMLFQGQNIGKLLLQL
jgi:hypothetical protein